MTNINLQLWTNQWRKLSVALKGITRHIDMELAFPSPTNHLKCRLSILFSFPVNSIQLCNYVWTSKNPVCSLALLFLKLCVLEKNYVFLLPIGERFYLLRHFFVLWQAGHATPLASVCCFVSVLSDESPEGIYHLFASITITDDPCK